MTFPFCLKQPPWVKKMDKFLSCGYTSDFLLAIVIRFFVFVASLARGGGHTWRKILTKTAILSQKIQLIEFLAVFSGAPSLETDECQQV